MNPIHHGPKPYAILVKVILFYVITLVIFAAMAALTRRMPFAGHVAMLACVVLTWLLTVLFVRRDKISLKETGVSPGRTSTSRFLIGFAAGTAMVSVQVLILAAIAPVKFSFAGKIPWDGISLSLLLYLLIACREELAFRGYALQRLSSALSPAAGLVIITLVFILEHVMAGLSWKMAVIGPGLGGVLFGLAALKTKGIALPIGLHFSWNFMQWLLGFKDQTGIWRELVEKGQERYAENAALISYSIVMVLAIAGVAFFVRSPSSQPAV